MSNIRTTMSLLTLEEQLVAALRDYDFHGTIGFRDTAYTAIHAYVDAMRASGHSAESVVISVKRIARRAGYGPPAAIARRETMSDRDRRVDGFVTCAIGRYFRLGSTTMHDEPDWIPGMVVC